MGLLIVCVVFDSSFSHISCAVMVKFSKKVRARRFDNFTFIHYNEVINKAISKGIDKDILFAIYALNNVPVQYGDMKKFDLIGGESQKARADEQENKDRQSHTTTVGGGSCFGD